VSNPQAFARPVHLVIHNCAVTGGAKKPDADVRHPFADGAVFTATIDAGGTHTFAVRTA